VDSISPAFQHAKQQLFLPFRIGQWWRLALVGFLAGELSSGGGCNFSVPSVPRRDGSEHLLPPGLPFGHLDPLLLAGLIALLVAAVFVLWILFIYVNSVMRFILFDSVLQKECHIRQGWKRRHGQGFRYFLWQLFLAGISLAGFIILVGIPAAIALALGWFERPGQHVIELVLAGIALFFILAAFLVCFLIVMVLSKDFVVPQMAFENIGAFAAWRRLWAMFKGDKGGYAGYLGMKLLLAIAAAILLGVVTVILLLVILIPVGGFGIVAVLAGKAAGLTWNVYTITLVVVVGAVLLAAILYLFSLVSVPAIVFFPAYSIYFFASRYPPLAAVLYPAPPDAPPSGLLNGPPLMPAGTEPIG
jgi:hypothetical protein